jgi:2-succinyl-6-hydroxy-2,4-cyclohexadiene-1-carboxylate synthase
MDFAQASDAIASLAGGGPIDLIGYSLGARIALASAVHHPESVHRLVLISGTAGIEDSEERERRRGADEAMADRLEASGDLAGFLADWLAKPMFASLGAAAGLEARLSNTPRGLADSLRRMGTGTMVPCWEQLAGLRVPTLVIAGGEDAKFVGLAERLVAELPNATLARIAGAGHACHLEAPEVVGTLIEDWLCSTN